jgi:hypothetical protein
MSRWRRALLATLLLAACPEIIPGPWQDYDDDEHSRPDGAITGIRAGPRSVQAVPSAGGDGSRSFRLFAWFKDGDSLVGGRTEPMTWKMDPSDGTPDGAGLIALKNFPANNSDVASIRVFQTGKDAIADEVKITRWANPAAATASASAVTAGHTPGQVPSVALIEEHTDQGCRWGEPRAFIGAAAVGRQTGSPCSVSVFSGDQAMSFEDNPGRTRWVAGEWSAGAAPHPGLAGQPLKLPVTIFLTDAGSGATDATQSGAPSNTAVDQEALARDEVERANMLYQDNRIGVVIDVKKYVHIPPEDVLIRVGADPFDCSLPHGLGRNPAEGSYAYEPSHVSVYYVDRINFPPDPAAPRVRGVECHFWYSGNPAGNPPGEGPVVYISTSHHSAVTLAHELGHVLGLNDEEFLGGLNIMNSLLPDGPLGAEARSLLTVGQGFRMNVWNDSWITTRLPRPPLRACDEIQCPEMGWDVP